MNDDELEQLKAEEQQQSDDKNSNSWIGGAILIGVGVIFLLNNFTDFALDNWWALFILIPALAILGNALRAYRAVGRLTSEVINPLIGGLMMLFVASIFLFELDWSNVWPVFIIIAGIGALLNAFVGRGESTDKR